jgi:pyruvate dehydrogenase E1 component alpha subunit
MKISKEKLQWMYKKMLEIREFEDRAAMEYKKGKIPGSLHLYSGMEAVAVGVCAILERDDYVASTHRGHGHCIAKNVDIKKMMAELFGKSTGVCKGKGGSMHVADFSKGMIGAIPIVGAGAPLACGPALMAKYKGTKQVSVTFFGDGASNQGGVFESLNLAAIWKLPVLFVCENNLYAESTPILYNQIATSISEKVNGFGIPTKIVDGMNVLTVFEETGKAINHIRSGKGPFFIECETYRYRGHFEGDTQLYQLPQEMDMFKKRDCISNFREYLIQNNLFTEEEISSIDVIVDREIDESVKFAEASPYPNTEETLTEVYS